MARLRYNNSLGTLGGSGLTSGGTTITFQSAPSFATLAAGDYIPLILEPSSGSAPSANFEVAYLTAYTAGATTGTISRGREGTTAVSHPAGAIWVCGPTAEDAPAASSGSSPFAIPTVYPEGYYWPLQDAAAPASELVNGLNLTNSGATFAGAGPNGDAAVVFASGQYLTGSATLPAFNPGASGVVGDVIAFWLYLTANPGTQQRLINIADVSVSPGLVIDILTGGQVWSTFIGGGASPNTTSSVPLNTWTRIAYALNVGVWFNGVKDATAFTGMGGGSGSQVLPVNARAVINGTSSGGTPSSSTLACRVAKLVTYPVLRPNLTDSATDAARIAKSDWAYHRQLAGA